MVMSVRVQSRSPESGVIVVGSGMAGLVCALSFAPRPVTLITKTPRLESGSSFWAKGGIAAAVGPGDSPEEHASDTLSAGAGLSDARRALDLARQGADSLELLIDEGVPFDRGVDGTLALAREAAHGRARVVHAGGDATGRMMTAALIERVRATPSISVRENAFAWDLLVGQGRVRGMLLFDAATGWEHLEADNIVLATGGIGMAWQYTTNPRESTGDGLAMAARAGARLTDLEFVQFHPTAIATGGQGIEASLPLLTEALRGAGATLIDETGYRFMTVSHVLAELAPRDIVARAIERHMAAGHRVFLDLQPVIRNGKAELFPEALDASRQAGFDPATQPVPVVPAAHYHMGGIHVDDEGRSSLPGLWACGEVASTGIHGANRLASNSLLEAVVYARRVARAVEKTPPQASRRTRPGSLAAQFGLTGLSRDVAPIVAEARHTMSLDVGIMRSGRSLARAADVLADLDERMTRLGSTGAVATFDQVTRSGEAHNLLLTSRLVCLAAAAREESRGAHYRDDFPQALEHWRRRQSVTVTRPEQAGTRAGLDVAAARMQRAVAVYPD
jgi:L-aspartate oxidase